MVNHTKLPGSPYYFTSHSIRGVPELYEQRAYADKLWQEYVENGST